MGRADSLAKLAWAYGLHQSRRVIRRPRSQVEDLLQTYAADGIRPVEPELRAKHPGLVTCINCGLCAFAAARFGRTRPPDLASSYMRLYPRMRDASSDVTGDVADLAAASVVCPVGVPLEEVAGVVRRMSMR